MNPNATRDCGYCAFRTGDAYMAQFGLDWNIRWRDMGLMIMFLSTSILLLTLAGT